MEFFERQDIFVATKLWNEFHKPEDVEPALRQSLMNLGLEYLGTIHILRKQKLAIFGHIEKNFTPPHQYRHT